MYHGKGFNHGDVYNMPVYLRRFYLETLISQKEKERDEIEKSQKQQNAPVDPRLRF